MTIDKTVDDSELYLSLEGRLDTTTAPELESVVKEIESTTTSLALDFKSLDYLSSAGLRVILAAQKLMNKKKGRMIIKNVNDVIMEVFEVTGFTEILTIE